MPNVGPYMYDVSISGLTRSSIYIYEISSLRINSADICHSQYNKQNDSALTQSRYTLRVLYFVHRASRHKFLSITNLMHFFMYSKTCLKRNAIVPVFFFFRFHRFPFYKGLCFNKTKYKKYDRLGLQ